MAAVQGNEEQELCPALADLWHTHYRSLLRLSALLTADTGSAEAVVQDAFVTMHRLRKCTDPDDGGLSYLLRLVVTASRRAAGQPHPADGGQVPAPAGVPGRAGTHELAPGPHPPVVLALSALPAAQREAVVLTLYLDLNDQQAAAAMRVSPAALRRFLAAARAALRTMLPAQA
jgi:DNA-directed RNA polymerase specialized sigma24 family protein